MSAKAGLGRLLFEDTNLSNPPGQSCATCHAAGAGFADPDRSAPTSKGVLPGRFGDRNTPTAAYMAFSPAFHYDEAEGHYVGGQFWDGRAATLEAQAKEPFLNPLEMANESAAQVVEKVRAASYAPLFVEVFGRDALADPGKAYERVAEAIAAWQRTAAFSPFSSKYDAFLAGRARLSAQELRGLRLFEREDKGNCAACHPVARGEDGRGGLGTDFTYDNLGVPKNPANPFYRLAAEHNPAGQAYVDRGLGGVVGKAGEYGKFKVPTVRNVALTAPYMHNGYFESLRAVVDFYNTRDVKPRCAQEFVPEREALRLGCWPRPEMVANVNSDELGKLGLSAREVDDIVAFLHTLTDGWKPADRRRDRASASR
ncbi:c-type cytochrome [Burkholderiaceae bacterium FT117]|uniref:cytochrome-c peroxidase n=1 Tax=Zeimonas sediminis TaxID=2944268 RepID=UPI002342CEEB|nr:cytochrome c peroxidase [Zeimonas sediminis]MCM5571579.1 c-type cytochrome [Zeimonas sediminis]